MHPCFSSAPSGASSHSIALAIAIALGAPIAHGAAAPDAADLPDHIVVTATRRATELADVPAAVSLVTAGDIEAVNASRVGDALLKVPSLYLETPAQGLSHASSSAGGFSLRGLDQRRSLVLLDGQPLQNGNSLGVDWRTVFMDDVARIEVVPGTFSSLYGSSAIGGVINILSKTADRPELTGRIKVGTGDAQGTDASVYYRDRFANRLGIVVGVGIQDRDGYVNDFVLRQPVAGVAGTAVTGAVSTPNRQGIPSYLVGDKGATPWKQKNAVLRLSYEFENGHRVTAGATASDFRADYGPFNSYLTSAAGAAVSSGTLGINGQRVTLTENNFVTSAPLVQESRRYFVGYSGQVAQGWQLAIDVARINRQDRFPTAGTTALWGSGAGTLTDAPNSGTDANVMVTVDAWERHTLTVGAAYHNDGVDRDVYALANWRDPDNRGAANSGYEADSSTLSLYAQEAFRFSDALSLYAGARLDRWDTSGIYYQNTAPATSISFPTRTETSFSPKVSVLFKPIDAVSLRASVGTSFRTPSNLDLYSTTVISSSTSPTGFLTTRSDPGLKPESGVGAEAGIDWRVGQALQLGATLHHTTISDMIYSQNIDLSLTQRINAGKAKISGIELTAGWRPLGWLDVDGSYSYLDSEITENDADATSVGKRLTGAPQTIGSVSLTAHRDAWTGSLTLRHSGKAFTLADNSDVIQGVPQSKDAYRVVNGKVGYQVTGQWQVTVAGNNLFDSEAYDFYRLPGRNFTFEIVGRF